MHSTLANGKTVSKRDILRLAKDREVRFVRLSFVDILGISKSVSIPASELERALEGKVTFDGGSIDGFVRGEEADMRLLPDLTTFAVYPWTNGGHNEARLICNIATPDGEPFEGCPRTTLMRAIDDASDVAAGLQSGLEVEFYLFDVGTDGVPTTESNDVGSKRWGFRFRARTTSTGPVSTKSTFARRTCSPHRMR
jgi:glutamine synthetase